MGIGVGLPLLLEMGTERNFSLLREWLQDCDKSHSDHRYDSANKKLPTRLLDVGDSKNSERLLLYDTNEKRGEDIEWKKYIALSHCWGGATPLRTEKGTIEAHRKAMKFEDLPELFQDAVTVTRNLGMQFLWIDSLCIIQDDENDWQREAKRMQDIFASAYCTIAASTAKNSKEHFLPRTGKRVVKLVDNSTGTSFNIYACEVGGSFNDDVEKGELNKRGWVLQERALSPRTIHFAGTYTYWECGSVIRCDNLTQMAKPSNLLSSSRFPMMTAGPPSGGAVFAFEDIFARYSQRALTRKTDRPYAIAGLERRLEQFYWTKSSHGIIHRFLGKSLLWQRSDKALEEIKDFKMEIVPSWSWMRYEGKICYGNIPTIDTSWDRSIELIPTSLNGPAQYKLVGSVAQILPSCSITLMPDTTCKIKCTKVTVGCIRFDNENQLDVGRLGCIVLARHKPNGWNEISQESWKKFARVSWDEQLESGILFYVLVVSYAALGQACEAASQRLGVAVIQGEYLSFSEPPRRLEMF
ncbi:heterokaryon incompatibility protein-domain-containing protein [Bisporella sp. PMI_857]|nr:heterokaryon incompatibility protein-domain-containing protein [Bisporella sp. PMI_857]